MQSNTGLRRNIRPEHYLKHFVKKSIDVSARCDERLGINICQTEESMAKNPSKKSTSPEVKDALKKSRVKDVYVSAGLTLNLGDYQSARVDAGMTIEVGLDATPEEAYAEAWAYVQEQVNSRGAAIKAHMKGGNATGG